MNITEIQSLFGEKSIQFFLISFVDMHGTPRAKLVPAAHLEDVLEGAAGFAGFAVDGLGQGPHDPDLSCVPQTDSPIFPLPWKPGMAWIAGNLQMDGKNWDYCPRAILTRNLEDARAQGFALKMGVEPEFFLVDKKADGSLCVADAQDTLAKPCYGQLSLLRNADFLMTLLSYCNDLGYGAYQNDHEDANGQFEINWQFAGALKTADQVSFFKFMVKALAEERGHCATFMPKPFAHLTGSGAHHHLSLWDLEEKDNLFLDKSDSRGLSSLALSFLGGLLAHAKGLCALTAPSVNSYKRFGARSPRSGATWGTGIYFPGRQQPDNDGASASTGPVRVPDGRQFLKPLSGGGWPACGRHGRHRARPEGGCRARRQLVPAHFSTSEGAKHGTVASQSWRGAGGIGARRGAVPLPGQWIRGGVFSSKTGRMGGVPGHDFPKCDRLGDPALPQPLISWLLISWLLILLHFHPG